MPKIALALSLVVLLLTLVVGIGCDLAQAASPSPVGARNGMVVTSQHLATKVGVDILKQGGNAVDAAVAVGYALGVVFPAAGNIGGGGFMTIQLADGRKTFIDFRETAPLAATADMYLDRDGNVIRGLSTKGYLAAGVPGNVAGFELALAKYGTMKRAAVMAPAIRLAQHGFVLEQGDVDLLADRHAGLSRGCAVRRGLPPQRAAVRGGPASRPEGSRPHARAHRKAGERRVLRGPRRRRHRGGKRAWARHHHEGGPRPLSGEGARADRVRLSRLQDRLGAAAELRRRDPVRNPRHPRRLSAAGMGLPVRARRAPPDRGDAPRVRRSQQLSRRSRFRPQSGRAPAGQELCRADPRRHRSRQGRRLARHEARRRAARGHQHHALFDRRQGRQCRGGHLHAERMVRREGHAGDHRHRHEQRDGRLHRQSPAWRTSTGWCRARPMRSPPASGRCPRCRRRSSRATASRYW